MYEYEVICTAVLAVALYTVYNCIYNLYFHPLSRFPGPRLAAIGHLYDLWYDCIKDGRYAWKVREMHVKYGPIVRVNCRELHILDPDFYSTIYSGPGQGRVDKDPVATAGFTVPNATLGTLEHARHRARREVLNPYFSKRAVVGLDPVINGLIARLVSRCADYADSGKAVDLDAAFGALTGDIISTYVFGFSWNFLDVENFKFPERDGILGLINWYHWSTFVPQAAKILRSFPLSILQIIHPGIASMESARLEVREQLAAVVKGRPRQDDKPEINAGPETLDGEAAIVSALYNGTLPPEERTIDRMTDEGMTLIFAGTETTGRTLAVTMFHILNNRAYLERLRKELADALPKCLDQDYQFSMTQIEQLPFLTAVVQEGLRCSVGPMVRQPRNHPDKTIRYKEHLIPAGTPLSTITYLVHFDPSLFPDPHKFDPDRWLDASGEGPSLKRFLVAFTKGSRQCLGINLAYAEIYLTIAKLITSYDMELHETGHEDVQIHHGRLTGFPKSGKGKIQVKVTKRHVI